MVKNILFYILIVVIVLLIIYLNYDKTDNNCPKELACSFYQVFNKPVDCLSNPKQSYDEILKCFMDTSKDIKLNTLLYLKSKGFKGPNALENYTKLVSKNMRSVKNMSEIEQAKFQKQKLHQLKHDFEHWVSKNNIKIENLAIDMLKASGLANEFI